MLETKDPAIKLFGKTIPLPPKEEVSVTDASGSSDDAAASHDCNLPSSTTTSSKDDKSSIGEDKNHSRREFTEAQQEDTISHLNLKDKKDLTTSSGITENHKTPSVDKESSSSLETTKNGEQSETSISQDKTLKKPDKILPCPRCNSMDTKFCYYNNYNVNQPRYFCKNCQRYWTAGGTMRNVPVGAGRRKNKHTSASYYHHIMVSEALQSAQSDAANGVCHPSFGNNGSVLNFGLDAPSESTARMTNHVEKTQNFFHGPEQRNGICEGGENGDDHSSNSTTTASNSTEKGGTAGSQEPMMRNFIGFPPQVPCFPGPQWPYPWNSAMPPPPFFHPGFPVPFYPTPTYWGCSVPSSSNVPWISSPAPTSPDNFSPNSSILGKHSRDGSILHPSNSEKEEHVKGNDSERCIWIPKTLRIDDPSEAAKSSIWATLGIKKEKTSSISGGGLFRAFQPKGQEKSKLAENCPVLLANPAALSRSFNFHEST